MGMWVEEKTKKVKITRRREYVMEKIEMRRMQNVPVRGTRKMRQWTSKNEIKGDDMGEIK